MKLTRCFPAQGAAFSMIVACAAWPLFALDASALGTQGYYRQPAISAEHIVFVAEGDLWRVDINGGNAQRLTTNLAEETFPRISPDGKLVAFTARYEGPAEVYVMPVSGGLPARLTYDGDSNARVQGFTADGKVLYSTSRWSGKPDQRMYAIDIATRRTEPLPLSQAAEGCFVGRDFYFTRLPLSSDNVKNYRGGLVQNIWRGANLLGANNEAVPMTADYAGISRQPMCAANRVYFLSDRDGTMNLWSMSVSGADLKQHTRHREIDIRNANIAADGGRISYQRGADIHVLDVAANQDRVVDVKLVSDLEHQRTRWVKTPWDFVTDVEPSPTGDRVAITARGEVFVFPVGNGRRVSLLNDASTRARAATFSSDGRSVFAFTDASGEFELQRLPANGVGKANALTKGAKVLRLGISVSPDGKTVLHHDMARNLYATDLSSGDTRVIDRSSYTDYANIAWSPDSRYIVIAKGGSNQFEQLWLIEIASAKSTLLTSARYDARDAAFSPDGKWLYFLSNRNLQTVVSSPWGQRNPQPFFDRQARIYAYALDPSTRWPFQARNELETPQERSAGAASTAAAASKAAEPAKPSESKSAEAKAAPLMLDGVRDRLFEVPVAAGNYRDLSTDGKRLYFVVNDPIERKSSLRSVAIEAPNPNPPTVDVFIEDIRSYRMTQDRKKLLVRRQNERQNDLWVFDTGKSAPAPAEQARFAVNTRDWFIELDPKREWRQMFDDAWRMHRDYFYDPGMHGADWVAAKKRYQPLLARVTDRAEVNDLIAQMISEVRALHSQVVPGDLRIGSDTIDVAALGIDVTRVAEGFRIERFMQGDPELLEERSPLARPEVGAKVGDIITAINGRAAKDAVSLGELLRQQADRQVLVSLQTAAGGKRDVIVVPITALRDRALRYLTWERERADTVEKVGEGKIGYLHLQAMGPGDIARWAREFFPVYQRDGLIIDLRNNNGGNIDSWIIQTLQRRAWHFFQRRYGERYDVNQQLAFRGHVVAIIDANTYSDGETLAQGLRRLGIATLVGTTTAGAGIWLSDQNSLRDGGRARAANFGTFVDSKGERAWITEGAGVAPDVRVDNLPVTTYRGSDAQLERAIAILKEKIAKEPVVEPQMPAFPRPATK
jgi:tricorn protease